MKITVQNNSISVPSVYLHCHHSDAASTVRLTLLEAMSENLRHKKALEL